MHIATPTAQSIQQMKLNYAQKELRSIYTSGYRESQVQFYDITSKPEQWRF